MTVLLIVIGAVFGAILGSFACCQAHRLRYRELGKKSPGSRSVCLRCHHQLKWRDNLPIISWLALRGRCRYCRKPIGLAEILSEVSMSVIIALTVNFYSADLLAGHPLAFASLVCLAAIFTVFWILLLYDAQYGRLPTSLLLTAVGLALIFRLLNLDYTTLPEQFISLLAGIGLLAGLYYILYIVSHEQWVGSGDWLLGLAVALVLGNWWLALVELFVSNSLALGGILAHSRRERVRQTPFGPYLVIACVLIFLLQKYLAIIL